MISPQKPTPAASVSNVKGHLVTKSSGKKTNFVIMLFFFFFESETE
jgi:hypothetical protein